MNTGNKKRRVAIYGRVSTEHDAQLSAFENQQAWYETEASRHPDWIIVARFYDEGITGTAAKKRPQFMQMIKRAQKGEFDLIVTREVCRFARNTVDSLSYTRELKALGVEVYFISDNLWTFADDSELRLSIFATLAQDESRKISERVHAGQKISREKGVLYGTGNILGYDRVDGTYVINEAQAGVVRKIFDLYEAGLGFKKICNELTRLGYKNASGKVEWVVSNICRIIQNATYKGYICYNKSHSDNYLTQKRVNHRIADYQYIKGTFEPIISEEQWDNCQKIRTSRRSKLLTPDGQETTIPRNAEKSIWTKKLRCSCGSSFQRYKWHVKENGSKDYGYTCYRQARSASKTHLIQHGLNANIVCQSKSIPAWQLDLMASEVFKHVFHKRKDAVLMACKIIAECYTKDSDTYDGFIDSCKDEIAKLKKRQRNLREMCADGIISRSDFMEDSQQIDSEIQNIEAQMYEIENTATAKDKSNTLDLDYIQEILDSWTSNEASDIPDSLIEQFILQVVLIDDNTFNWTLDLSRNNEDQLTASQIATQLYRNKQQMSKYSGTSMEGYIDTMLDKHILNPKELFSFNISEKEAREFCHEHKRKFFGKKWEDKKIIISI